MRNTRKGLGRIGRIAALSAIMALALIATTTPVQARPGVGHSNGELTVASSIPDGHTVGFDGSMGVFSLSKQSASITFPGAGTYSVQPVDLDGLRLINLQVPRARGVVATVNRATGAVTITVGTHAHAAVRYAFK